MFQQKQIFDVRCDSPLFEIQEATKLNREMTRLAQANGCATYCDLASLWVDPHYEDYDEQVAAKLIKANRIARKFRAEHKTIIIVIQTFAITVKGAW